MALDEMVLEQNHNHNTTSCWSIWDWIDLYNRVQVLTEHNRKAKWLRCVGHHHKPNQTLQVVAQHKYLHGQLPVLEVVFNPQRLVLLSCNNIFDFPTEWDSCYRQDPWMCTPNYGVIMSVERAASKEL